MKLSRILAFAGLCFLLPSCGGQPTTASSRIKNDRHLSREKNRRKK